MSAWRLVKKDVAGAGKPTSTRGTAATWVCKNREPSDYQVSILEVAGTSATMDDILAMEGRWQSKLQSRERELNRNSAGQS